MIERFPRFLGLDAHNSCVWELEDGRWTWGDEPVQAMGRERTFTPEEYVAKYGRPIAFGAQVDRKEEAELPDGEALGLFWAESMPEGIKGVPEAEHRPDPSLVAWGVLHELAGVVKGWQQDALDEHNSLGHRDHSGDECANQWHTKDIMRMIEDTASKLGIEWKAEL